MVATHVGTSYYHKCPNLVRTQVEIISDPNYLVITLVEIISDPMRTLFER